jgi:glutamate racemase
MQEAEQHPIGIFDSGVGGLTVLKALHQELPARDFLYVGDTARVPYGRKPREMVEQFAWEITGFLLDKGADAVVVACNTASAASLPRLADEMPIPIWGVVDPGVSAACKLTRSGRVGVIGTRGTIDSGAYQNRLRARGLEVWAQACPLFVHLVEEGLADSEEAEILAHHYLDSRPPIDTLILGCTHYPLLENVIRGVVGERTAIVSSAEAVAAMVRETLGAAPIAPGRRPGRVTHYVTGDAASYRHTAQRIGGVEGEIVKVDTLARAAPRALSPAAFTS